MVDAEKQDHIVRKRLELKIEEGGRLEVDIADVAFLLQSAYLSVRHRFPISWGGPDTPQKQALGMRLLSFCH